MPLLENLTRGLLVTPKRPPPADLAPPGPAWPRNLSPVDAREGLPDAARATFEKLTDARDSAAAMRKVADDELTEARESRTRLQQRLRELTGPPGEGFSLKPD